MQKKIGIFDSGLGGLTVLRELEKTVSDGVQLIYLGDTARVPYGSKSPSTIRKYALQAAQFFSEMNVGTMVIACHSASAVAVEVVREVFPRMRIVGVIEPGVQTALDLADAAGSVTPAIGVISTRGTHRSEAYINAIRTRNATIQVISQPCPLFVPLVEEGWAGTDVAAQIAHTYLAPFRLKPVQALILGCTHYPIMLDDIRQQLPASTVLIDSAAPTAQEVCPPLQGVSTPLPTMFFVTDISERFSELAGRFLGRTVDRISRVDLEPEVVALPSS